MYNDMVTGSCISMCLNLLVPINVCRGWNSELENLMKVLQEFLEEECETYFVNIKKRAVKVHFQGHGLSYPRRQPNNAYHNYCSVQALIGPHSSRSI